MGAFHSDEALRALAEQDPTAFAEALSHHGQFRYRLFALVPLLQERPDLVAALRAAIPGYRRDAVETWLGRRTHPGRPGTPEAFLELANRLARERDPGFFEVSPADLEVRSQSMYHCARSFVGEDWTVEGESRDIGPAEVIREEEWTARARHPEWELEVGMFASSGLPTLAWSRWT